MNFTEGEYQSRMSVRNITEMNSKNRKSRDRRFYSASFPRPLLENQFQGRPKPNFCLQITKRESTSAKPQTPTFIKMSSSQKIIIDGLMPKLRPKMLQDNPFMLGNIIRKKLRVLAEGDIDKYLSSIAMDAIRKKQIKPRVVVFNQDPV